MAVGCVLMLLGVVAACTGDDEDAAPLASSEAVPETEPSTEQAPVETLERLTDPVAATRRAILDAANARDYDALAALVDPEVFLSDAGFGVDPLPYWRDLGAGPLETMQTLLNMASTTSETNEGKLYQWPRFTENSSPEDMDPRERKALVALLGEAGLEAAFQAETGYLAPRLGILADGTWWFLILQPAA